MTERRIGENTMSDVQEIFWLVTPGNDAVNLDAGRRFWKELIREGRWTNAHAGFTLEVDAARMKQWKEGFDKMAEAGIRVPVPWGHSYDPRDNAGFVEELELRDSALWGLLSVPNEPDAEKLGRTVTGVSVSINPNFTDGSGRDWGEVIEHVALTNYPVVGPQGGFLPASAVNGDSRRALELELDGGKGQLPDLEALRLDLGIDGELNRANFADAVRARFDELNAELENSKAELVELRAMDPDRAADDEAARQTQTQQHPQDSELTGRLCQLERERADRELGDAVLLGRFTRPAAEALRNLLTAGVTASYAFDAAGAEQLARQAGQLARDIIANTPDGAAVDMAEHTRLHQMPEPSAGQMDDARAARLAKENKALAGI